MWRLAVPADNQSTNESLARDHRTVDLVDHVSQSVRLSWVLALNLALIAGLVIAGMAARSLGVLAAAGDTAVDCSAIVLGLAAIHLRDRHGKAAAPTYIAGVNAALLLLIVTVVIVTAIQRLTKAGMVVHGLPVLIASLVAMIVMLASAALLGRDAAREDLHMRSVLLDTLADALAAAGVAIVGTIIMITGRYYWLDPAVAIIISTIIAASAGRLLRDVVTALRHRTYLDVGAD